MLIAILKQVLSYYQILQKLLKNRILKAFFLTDQSLYIRGSKSWFGCLADFFKNMKLPDFDSLSSHKFESKVESIYMEKLSDSTRKRKFNKDS